VLYASDTRWWSAYGAEVDRLFRGERWTCSDKIRDANFIQAVDEPGLSTNPNRVHLGGNSGYQAVGLAYLWGAARIILLGYDMQAGPDGNLHHHARHGGALGNPTPETLKEWARRFVQMCIDLRREGVEVINATRETALKCFERLPLEAALRRGTIARPKRMTAALRIPADLLPQEHRAFAVGLKSAGYELAEDGADVSVIWGNAKAMPAGKVLVAENGYWSSQDEPQCALALGGHNGAGQAAERSPERFQRLGIALEPWRQDGGHILLCPSRGIGLQPMPKDWVRRTTAELRKHTDREIRVRPHPGNWKRQAEHPAVSLSNDRVDAWACVIWASAAGLRALAYGVPVIYTAPHWIAAEAAGNDLAQIEQPPMPDRLPAFERMAAAQWTLSEIESGEPFRRLLGSDVLTVLCVLRSGGDYNAEYVRKLRDGVAKHLTIPHRFVCLSDVPVPCERIPLKHDWPGWWAKLELFRPDVVTGPTLFLDLDTIIVGNLDAVATIPDEFSMLNIREKDRHVGNSGAMWMRRAFSEVYERFAEKPEYWIDYHVKHAKDRYMGDQAFISDCFADIPKLHHALPGFFKSYKYDNCRSTIPAGCSVVCFGGHPRPHEAGGWVKEAWV
jgi:hypothetical protein